MNIQQSSLNSGANIARNSSAASAFRQQHIDKIQQLAQSSQTQPASPEASSGETRGTLLDILV